LAKSSEKFRLPVLNKEAIDEIVGELSGGNSDLNLIMKMSCLVSGDLIENWPDDEDGRRRLAGKLIFISGCLIRCRIDPSDFSKDPREYWKTERGQVVGRALSEFVERKGWRVRMRG
jgi:hypothetical protein